MRCLGVGILISVAAAFPGTATAQEKAPAKAQEPKTVTIAGRAVDLQGRPLAGCAVRIWLRPPYQGAGWFDKPQAVKPDRPAPDLPRTDAEGRFEFPLTLAARTQIWVQAEAQGRVAAATDWIPAGRAGPEAVGTLTLPRLRTVSGRVVDRDGRPVAGAEVFQTGDTEKRTTSTTDEQGRFRLPDVVEQQAIVFIRKKGFRFQGRIITEADDVGRFVLVRRDEPVPPLATLPPPLAREEELRLCHELADEHWQAVMTPKADPAAKFQACFSYCWLDPWEVFDRLQHDNPPLPPQSWIGIAPSLYLDDPEAALAEIEAIDDPHLQVQTLLNVSWFLRADETGPRLELLQRARLHSDGIKKPTPRLMLASEVAASFFELGERERERAETALDHVASLAKAVFDDAALGRYAEALAPFDPAEAVKIVNGLQGQRIKPIYQFRVAYQLAALRPDEADRLLEAIASPARTRNAATTFDDLKAAAVCYRMASADWPRALDIADRMGHPCQQAYAYGMIASALPEADRPRALELLAEAFDLLEKSIQQPGVLERLDADWLALAVSPATVAAALLPVVERLDPSLVAESMWRAAALRPPLAIGRDSNTWDSAAASLLARYDHAAAAAVFQRPMRRVRERTVICIGQAGGLLDALLGALPIVDPARGAALIKAIPEPPANGPPGGGKNLARFEFVYVLARPVEARWRSATARLGLWVPGFLPVDLPLEW